MKGAQELHLWMNGVPVGYWRITRQGHELGYFPQWLAHPQGRPISLSLPFLPGGDAHRGDAVASYFDNLLPDSENIRTRLARRYQVRSVEPFSLLSAVGQDCVGAIQLLPPGVAPTDIHRIAGEPLNEGRIANLLRLASGGTPIGRHREEEDDLRLSIAGAQEKTALLHHGGQWLLPHGSTPTTHIFKLPMGLVGNMQADLRTSVENEWLCAKIVAAYGLDVAPCEMAQFEDQKVLIVERFDRQLSEDGSWIMRLPQEDMCQATGTPPHLKYNADGGPGIGAIMALLAGSEQAITDMRAFFAAQLVFWMLFATDGHAKNFSIRLLPGGGYVATPLYDVLSALPIIGRGHNQIPRQKAKLAMGVRGSSLHYLITRIQRRHWEAQAQSAGLTEDDVAWVIDYLTSKTAEVIEHVAAQLPPGFPEAVSGPIFAGLKSQADALAAAPCS